MTSQSASMSSARCGGVLNYLIGPIKLIRSVKKTPRVRGLTATAAFGGRRQRGGAGRRGRDGSSGRAPIIRNSCKRCGLTALYSLRWRRLFVQRDRLVYLAPPTYPRAHRPALFRILVLTHSHTHTHTLTRARAPWLYT